MGPAVLHGRETPMRALHGALDAALAGRGQLAVISGEAGIGKSALATAIADEAASRGASVASALARSSEAAPVVWILEDLNAADLGTLDLLTFLAQPLRAMRVLVVATTRAKDPRLSGASRSSAAPASSRLPFAACAR